VLTADEMAPTCSSEVGKAIGNRKKELFKRHYLENVKMFPRARDLLMKMKRSARDAATR